MKRFFPNVNRGTESLKKFNAMLGCPDRLDNAAKFNSADRRAGKQGSKQEVISRTDNGQPENAKIGFSEKTVAGEACSEHDDPWFCIHGHRKKFRE